ncbi:MAG TPA: adenylate/guanylate cyclase domain-containing protein, partial [Candidatus Ozemobacteraceae bacterium]|nr:adenylate/guanylate cyclase domain-containing protein [Candidatus Ozemobacteraceae bacterium]
MSLRHFEPVENRRLWAGVIALVWLLFVALPALGLRSAVRLWLEDEEKGMRTVLRRQLIDEMREFKNEIETGPALERAFLAAIDDFGFRENLSPASAAALRACDEAGFKRICASVTARVGSKPAVAAMLIPSSRNMLIDADMSYFPGYTRSEVEKNIALILEPLMYSRADISKKIDTRDAVYYTSRNISEKLFGGDFHFADLKYGVNIDVVHFGGTAIGYKAAGWACIGPRGNAYSSTDCTALLVMLFHANAISRGALLRAPLGTSLNPSIRRRIVGVGRCDLPRFIDRPRCLALLQAPPLECPDEALWQGSRSGPRPGLRPVPAVVAEPSALSHPWRKTLPWFDVGLLLVSAGTSLVCLRLALFEYAVGKSLRTRVGWGFAFGAMIPCCGCAMMAMASAKAGEDRLPRIALTHMSRQLERLDEGLRSAQTIRAKTLQTWSERIISAADREGGVETAMQEVLARSLSRAILVFLANGKDWGASSYEDQSSVTPIQRLMKGFSQDALVRLGSSDGGGGSGAATSMQVTIDLAHAITSEYIDESYIKKIITCSPLSAGNPFGNPDQFMSVQISPVPCAATRPKGIIMTYGGLHMVIGQYFLRLLRKSPPEFTERVASWNIKYMVYTINSYNPPLLSDLNIGFDDRLWKKWRYLAESCLNQRMGRKHDMLPRQRDTLAVTRYFSNGNLIGVAVAEKKHREPEAGWVGAALAIAVAWSAVTVAAAFFLTLPFPMFLEATRLTTGGEFGWRIDLDRPDEFGDLARVFNGMARGLTERAGMARFVSDGVLAAVRNADSGASKMAAGGERIPAAILFSDIRGFTTLSEINDPEDVVTLLNDYFTLMEEPIRAAGGTIETYLGDAILAVFPPDSAGEEPELRAVKAAFGMREALARFNDMRRRNGRFTIETGIGVAAGTILWGRLGGEGDIRAAMIKGDVVE